MPHFRTAAISAVALLALLTSACALPGGALPSSPSPSSAASDPTQLPGSIAGQLGYPAEGIPPMTIYAIRQSGRGAPFYTVRAIKDQGTYTIKGVAPGTYALFATMTAGLGPRQRFAGGYTKFVLCGLRYGCTDHTPVPVTLTSGQAVTDIPVTDFYSPGPASFPFVPSGARATTPVPSPLPSYPDAIAAALYEAQRGTQTPHVFSGPFEQCPVNDACVALQEKQDGTRAAFFTAQAGSNTDVVTCGVYVFQDATGWHPLNTACGVYPAPGKTASATFMGSGCINVRLNPGYSGKIVECLPVDTMVTIDAGPVFIQESTASDAGNLNRLWWHLVGHGWVVHQYLTGPHNVN
jgi:hypothetical protein